MNLYNDLQKEAITSQYSAKVLKALKATLAKFNISENEQEVVGEALLRFRIFKDQNFQNLSYRQQSQLLKSFLMMDQYFTGVLRKSRAQPVYGLGQRLTNLQLKDYNVKHLFHRLWNKALGSETYDKKEWRELERRIKSHVKTFFMLLLLAFLR